MSAPPPPAPGVGRAVPPPAAPGIGRAAPPPTAPGIGAPTTTAPGLGRGLPAPAGTLGYGRAVPGVAPGLGRAAPGLGRAAPGAPLGAGRGVGPAPAPAYSLSQVTYDHHSHNQPVITSQAQPEQDEKHYKRQMRKLELEHFRVAVYEKPINYLPSLPSELQENRNQGVLLLSHNDYHQTLSRIADCAIHVLLTKEADAVLMEIAKAWKNHARDQRKRVSFTSADASNSFRTKVLMPARKNRYHFPVLTVDWALLSGLPATFVGGMTADMDGKHKDFAPEDQIIMFNAVRIALFTYTEKTDNPEKYIRWAQLLTSTVHALAHYYVRWLGAMYLGDINAVIGDPPECKPTAAIKADVGFYIEKRLFGFVYGNKDDGSKRGYLHRAGIPTDLSNPDKTNVLNIGYLRNLYDKRDSPHMFSQRDLFTSHREMIAKEDFVAKWKETFSRPLVAISTVPGQNPYNDSSLITQARNFYRGLMKQAIMAEQNAGDQTGADSLNRRVEAHWEPPPLPQ